MLWQPAMVTIKNDNDTDRFEDCNNDELLSDHIMHPMKYRTPPNMEERP